MSAVAALTPRMRRITLVGRDVLALAGPAMHVRIVLADPPETCGKPLTRYYTVRKLRPELDEIDIDVLLHEPAGPGMAWAVAARPGDRVAVVGPVGRPVPDAARLVLVGDETALPVILRVFEEWPARCHVDALIEVADRSEIQPVAPRACGRVSWIFRGGGTPSVVDRAMARNWRSDADLFCYAGLEAATAQTLRTRLDVAGVGPDRQRVLGYWRRQSAAAGR